MPPHSLSFTSANFERTKYYRNKSRSSGIYSHDNLPEKKKKDMPHEHADI